MTRRGYYLLIIFGLLPALITAQTCCSGGVPVSANLGFSPQDKGTLQVGVAADFIVLKALFAEGEELEDASRKRATQSYLIRAAYHPLNRLTIETLLPYVRQTRTIYGNNGEDDFQSTNGIGDAALLLNYDMLTGDYLVRVGAGTRVPLGKFDSRNNQGLFLVEDLQAGSGAWDALFFGSVETTLRSRTSATIYVNTIYRLTGTNNASRAGKQAYRFGNDLQLIAGYNDQYMVFNQLWTSGIALRYRSAERDVIDGFKNTGTGGRFLFVRINHGVALGSSQLLANIELPVHRFVNETQLAPSMAFGIGWYTAISAETDIQPNTLQ